MAGTNSGPGRHTGPGRDPAPDQAKGSTRKDRHEQKTKRLVAEAEANPGFRDVEVTQRVLDNWCKQCDEIRRFDVMDPGSVKCQVCGWTEQTFKPLRDTTRTRRT